MASSNGNQLELTAAQAELVQKALRHWSHSKLVSSDLISDLLATVQIVEEQHNFDWDKFAKYTFRLAVICLTIAIISLLFDKVVPKIIRRIIQLILALPAAVRVTATSALAVAVHVWGYQRSLATPQQVYLNEAVHSLGALLFGLAALQLGDALDNTGESVNPRILHNIQLLLATIYGVSAVLVQSNFIWSCGMIVFSIWFGTWAGYSNGAYYLGMDYPLRFVLFGAGLITASSFMRDHPLTAVLWSTTRIWGLLFLFISLWILSLYGNDKVRGDNHDALGRRIAFWSAVFLCAATIAIWDGLRYHDATTKGFGLTFLGINLYTQFFQFCWSAMYKSAFFAVLALSLALIGRYAESVNVALNERYSNLPS